MFPEYIYKPFDIFIRKIIVAIESISNRLEKLMYEGQGHKISTLKMKKKGIFYKFKPFFVKGR